MLKRMAYFVTLALFMAVITGCTLVPSTQGDRRLSQTQDGPTPTPIPTPIVPTKPVYEVQTGEVIDIVQFSGRVAPVEEVELFFRTGGRVRNIFVERDDLVVEGQVLADLEIDDLERDLATGLLELERVEQALEEAQQHHNDEMGRAVLRLDIAEANLQNAERDKAFEMARAEIDLTIKELQFQQAQNEELEPRRVLAQADLERAQIDLRRAQEAYNRIAYSDSIGSSSQAANLEQATLDYAKAQANYDLATQSLDNRDIDLSLMQKDIDLARLTVEELQTTGPSEQLVQNVVLAQLEVDILERGIDPSYTNNVEQARLNVERLEAAVADAQIIAPFDGKVTSISLTEGREVATFTPVAIVADPSQLEISSSPPDSQLQDLAEGMPVTISLSSRPGELFAGLVRRLPYPYGGGGRSQGVETEDTSTRIALEVPPEELGLDQGDLVRVEVILEQKESVFWLPPQAIRTFDGRKFVVVQDGDAQRRVDIKVGIEGEDRVEIEEGLTAGQIIVGP